MKTAWIAAILIATSSLSFANETKPSFKDVWKRVKSGDLYQLIIEAHHFGGDYYSTDPNFGFRTSREKIEIFSKDYRSIPAPVEVFRETFYFHKIDSTIFSEMLKQLEPILSTGSYLYTSPEGGIGDQGAALRIIWKNSPEEVTYLIPLPIEAYGKLVDIQIKAIRKYALHSNKTH